MKRGVSGAPIPARLPFADAVTVACAKYDFPPCLAYAVRQNETDSSTDPAEMQIGSIGDYMPDGSNAGHGPFQLTSSYPVSSNPAYDWSNPYENALYAVEVFLQPAWVFWTENTDLEGDDLVRAVSVSFNAGIGAAWAAHLAGNLDMASTDNYGRRALSLYHKLIGN